MKLRFYQTYDENEVYSEKELQVSFDGGDHWEAVPTVTERVVYWLTEEQHKQLLTQPKKSIQPKKVKTEVDYINTFIKEHAKFITFHKLSKEQISKFRNSSTLYVKEEFKQNTCEVLLSEKRYPIEKGFSHTKEGVFINNVKIEFKEAPNVYSFGEKETGEGNVVTWGELKFVSGDDITEYILPALGF